MEVYKRAGSPNWYYDTVSPTTGKRLRHSLGVAGSKTSAQKLAAAKVEALAEADTGETITIGQAVEQYIGSLASQGKPYARELRYTQRKLFTKGERYSLNPEMALHDLLPVVLERLVLARRVEGNKAQTIKHELGLLRAASRYAEGLGFKGPKMPGKNPWRTPEVSKKTRYLSVDEYERVYNLLDPTKWTRRQDVRDLLVTLAYTGGRWSEVAGLTWEQVDLERGLIRLWGNKTERERLVPISEALKGVLEARSLGRTYPSGLVFPGPTGGVRTAATRAIGAAMDAAGLNTPEMVRRHGRATVHSLRHTFASWLIQNGAELAEVSSVLGHASVTTTMRYAHLEKRAVVDRMAGILNSMKEVA